MTQRHDPVHPDSGDLDPDLLSAADDAYVRALLADLPDVPMPPEVVARIQAALAAEAAGIASEAPEPRAATTVVPLAAAARRATGWRNPRVLQAAAVVVLLVAGTFVGVKAISGKSPQGAASTAAGSVPAKDAVVRQTDHAYTTASLAQDVHTLVSGTATGYGTQAGGTAASLGTAQPPPTVPSPQRSGQSTEGTPLSLSAASSPLDPGVQRLLSSTAALAPCLTAIEDGLQSAVEPIAVDGGTYDGKPALVVVLPGSGDPTSYDVWIVGPTCGTNKDAALIRYQSVPRS